MTENPTRRNALKALAAATGAVTLASLPTLWAKPVVRVGAIPAHAQVSGCWGLILTVLDAQGLSDISVDVNFGPDTTMQTGTPGEDGWTLYWACQPACLELTLHQNDVEGGVVWDASSTFMASPGIFGNGVPSTSHIDLNANLGTGEFVVGGGFPDGCGLV